MRVLHIIKITGLAGAENHLLVLLPGLRQRGIDVRVILLVELNKPVAGFDAVTAAGVPVERMVIRHHADVTLYPRLWNAIRRHQPDIVHTHLLHADLYGIPAAKLAGVRAIVSSRHGEDDFRKKTPLKQVNWLLWQMADAGIMISDAVGRFTVEHEGAAREKLHTVYYGLDTGEADSTLRETVRRELGFAAEDVVAGIACRLIELKGVTYALQALAKIDSPRAHLAIIGDGPLRESLESEAYSLGIAERVHFLGWRSDAARLMAGLDVLLVTSVREGFGLVMLEAMAHGVPLIGSAVSAIPEVIVEGETGRLFPARDVNALARAWGELLENADLRRRMGEAGKKRLQEQFSVEKMIERTMAVYEKFS